MVYSTRIVLSICLLVCASSRSVTLNGAELSATDLIRPLQDVESAISALAVTSRIVIDRSGQERFDEDVVQEVVVDNGGRVRCEVVGERVTGDDRAAYVSLGAFDGVESMRAFGSRGYSHGLITSGRAGVGLLMDPRNMTTHYFERPVSAILETHPPTIVAREEFDGRDVLVVETEPTIKDNADFMYRFLIAPELNFAVVRRAAAIKFRSHDVWIEYTRIMGYEYNEVEPGIWVPRRVVHESFDPTEEHSRTGTDPPLSWRFEITNTKWEINPQLYTGLFTFEWPPGVLVDDEIRGRTFQVAGVSQELLAAQAEAARQFQETGGRGRLWLVIVLVGIAILTIAMVLAWRRIAQA